jgi:6-pyruvoyltetrahydropterin/6-carboxytetrahydropterin synthase
VIECTRRIEFDAAHRVMGHENKCKFLHGHRYVLEITARTSELDSLGRVVDFGVLKSIMKEWIDENLDHNVILYEKDKTLGELITKETGQNIYYLKSNPTAENIALHLKSDIIPLLFTEDSFDIVKLRLYETPNAYVEVNGQ